MNKLKYLNELLFKAFEISSQIWLFQKREEMLNFFCEQISELKSCTAVVAIDSYGVYSKMKEDVTPCRYLGFHPRTISVIPHNHCKCDVEHDYLVMIPYSKTSTIYFFLKSRNNICEETLQVLRDMVFVLSKALDNLETKIKLEAAFNQLQANLNHFQYLADKLRNPLAVILGVTELEGEIDCKKAFNLIRNSGLKIKKVLDEMRDSEITTVKLCNSRLLLNY